MPIGSWAPPQLPDNRLEIRIHCSKLRVQPSQLAHLLLLGRYKELSIRSTSRDSPFGILQVDPATASPTCTELPTGGVLLRY